MTPLGMDGHRLLSDMLSEAGLTPRARRRIPVICDLAGPIWVPGVAQSERTRVEGDEPAWRLNMAPLAGA
jgi:tRNA(Ile)-lysidine synthase